MDVNLFKTILKPNISAKSLKDSKKTAEAITNAYVKATEKITTTIFGSKLLSGNKNSLQTHLEQGLILNDKTRQKSQKTESGWFIMAMGFIFYWVNSKFTPVPPMPPSTGPAPGPLGGTTTTYQGDPKTLADDLKKALTVGSTEDTLNELGMALSKHLLKVSGIYTGVGPAGPQVTPWTGLFGKPAQSNDGKIIIDSKLTFQESISGTDAPKNVIDSLVLLDIDYISSDNKLHRGQILVNKSVQNEVKQFFKLLLEEKFPINRMIPVVKYGWNDDKSMEDNNTSGFNYRVIAGSNRMSKHSYGGAIDINPRWNPVIYRDGKVSPPGAIRDKDRPGVLKNDTNGVKYLKEKGWEWGGDYTSFKDWHHFDKDIEQSKDSSNVVPESDYSFSIFSPSRVTVDIGIPKIKQVDGKKIQSGFMLHDIPGWKDRNFIWSFANLTLYEPSGKATGVFVKNGKIANPETGYPYYTMISETTGRNFNKYVTIAIMKDNTVRLYETDSTTTAEQKILRDLKNIKYAFSGTDVLIRNGGETEERAISKLEDDKDRPKTSVGFYNNNLMVAVTTAKTSQNWEKWGNTLRKINSNATWISMDGGGSSTIVIKGTPRQVAENVPNGRKVATIIGWYDV